MDIRVVKIKKIEKGALQAFVDVQIGQVQIKGFRVVKQPGQSAWVSVPQTEQVKNGEKRYFNLIELPNDLKRKVQDAILVAWEERK